MGEPGNHKHEVEDVMTDEHRHDERCPTCGKYTSNECGYFDLPPGTSADGTYVVAYCNEGCAERKPFECIYEDEQTELELLHDRTIEELLRKHGIARPPSAKDQRQRRRQLEISLSDAILTNKIAKTEALGGA